MASQSSPVHSSPGENEDDPTAIPDSHYHTQDDADAHTQDGQDPTVKDEPGSGSQQPKQAHPMQKRRRVTRACDECRRKKIKCDGKQPCTHCTVYSYGKRSPASLGRRLLDPNGRPQSARMINPRTAGGTPLRSI